MRVLVDGVGQQASLIKPNITRGCADEPRDRMPLHVLGHVEARDLDTQRGGQLARHFGFADAGGAGEEVVADRLFSVPQAGARELDGGGKRLDGGILAEHHVLEVALQGPQYLLVVRRDGFGRDAGDFGDHVLHVLQRDGLAALALGLQHARGTCFVDHVDGFVRQLAVVDVLRRQLHGAANRVIGVADLVVLLVRGLQPAQDFHRILDRRLVDVDLLEAPHECAVLLEVVAEFLIRSRADAAQRALGQCGFQQVGGIHRAAGGRPGADYGMDFVDEQNRPRRAFHLRDDCLQPLLEVTAVARASQQRAHVERKNGAICQHFGHIAIDDALGQPLGDCGFTDTRVTHVQRVVLGAAAEDLDRALDLVLTPDQRVDFARQRLFVEVDAIGGQGVLAALGGALFLALGLRLVLRAGGGARGGFAGGFGDAVGDEIHRVQACHVLQLQEVHGVALAFREQRHQHIGAGHFIAARGLHMNGGALHHALETGGGFGIARAGSGQARQILIQELGQVFLDFFDVHATGA